MKPAKKTSKRTGGSRKRSRKPSPARVRPPDPATGALVGFAELAKREDIRWYVFGAEAVNLYGFPRKTADLDLTIDLGDRPPIDFLPVLRRAGFEPLQDQAFIDETRVIPVAHRATKLPIDLVLAGPGLEQLFLERVRYHRVGTVQVPVIAPEHLVVTKVLAGRPKDLEDVRELLAVAKLDREEIEALLGELEEALGQSDLVSRFRKLGGS